MGDRFANLRLYVTDTFWFVPALMALGSAVLAFITVTIDERLDAITPGNTLIFVGTPAGARQLLGAIASSSITVAGVVFSVTIVVLSQASGQFGPRLLRNFIKDRGNQVVLGTFIATFLYSLLVLRTVRGVDDSEFVPQISATMAVVLAVASVAVLIYFVHHVTSSIQAETVVMSSARELDASIERLFPNGTEDTSDAATLAGSQVPGDFDDESQAVSANGSGYLQLVQIDRLMEIAEQRSVLIKVEYHPGNFVTEGGVLARIWPGDRLDDALVGEINDAMVLGTQRTPVQDIEYSIDQLVEIAVRALSPGVNDPFTAINCVDRLGVALTKLARTEPPSPYRCRDGKLLVIAEPVSFGDLLDAAFNQVRQNARGNPAVSIRLLEAMETVARNTKREDDRRALREHADTILRSVEAIPEPRDRRDVESRYHRVLDVLQETSQEPIEIPLR